MLARVQGLTREERREAIDFASASSDEHGLCLGLLILADDAVLHPTLASIVARDAVAS